MFADSCCVDSCCVDENVLLSIWWACVGYNGTATGDTRNYTEYIARTTRCAVWYSITMAKAASRQYYYATKAYQHILRHRWLYTFVWRVCIRNILYMWASTNATVCRYTECMHVVWLRDSLALANVWASVSRARLVTWKKRSRSRNTIRRTKRIIHKEYGEGWWDHPRWASYTNMYIQYKNTDSS